MSKIDKMERNLQRYINGFGYSFKLNYPHFIAKFDSFQDLKAHINKYNINDFTIEIIKDYVVVNVINSKLFVGMNR